MAAPKNEEHFDEECKSVSTCSSIARIVTYLKEYQIREADEILKTFNKNNYPYLTDDFNHVLVKHLGDNKPIEASQKEFGLIHTHIMNNLKQCELEKCNKFARNNRNRQQENILLQKNSNKQDKMDDEIEYYINTMDTMHCFFIHTYDTGYRISTKDETEMKIPNNNSNANDNESYYDMEMAKVCSILQSKRRRLQNIRGIDRYKNTKFVTNVAKDNDDQKDKANKKKGGLKIWDKIKNKTKKKMKKEEKMEEKMEEKKVEPEIAVGSYSFGHKYNYWDIQNDNYVSAKYGNLLEEMTDNKICRIHLDVFNSIKNIAKKKLNSKYAKRFKAGDSEYLTSIGAGDAITLQHLMSILFYTDLDTLSGHFSSTFRSLNESDDIDMCKERNSEFAIWSGLLIETVNIYGAELSKSCIKTYYHGVNKLLVCSSFVTEFNAPTSTTAQFTVAALFAKKTGAIMELGMQEIGLRCFNCVWLSCFANEDERLFVCPPLHDYYLLKFTNIRSISDNMNYKNYIDALTTLQWVVGYTDQVYLENSSMSNIVKIIQNLANHYYRHTDFNNDYPEYVNRLFAAYVERVTEVILSTGFLAGFHHPELEKLFVNPKSYIPKINFICSMFINCHSIYYTPSINAKGTEMDFNEILFSLKCYTKKTLSKFTIHQSSMFFEKTSELYRYKPQFDAVNWNSQFDAVNWNMLIFQRKNV